MSKSKLFGDRSAPAISVVAPSVMRWYAHKARVTCQVVTFASGALFVAALWHAKPPVMAVFLGLLLGAACGVVAGLAVLVWPVVRALWWWATEIVLGLLVAAELLLVSMAWSLTWALVLLAVVGVAGWLVRPVRRFVDRWAWCVIVRHRLRVCFSLMLKAETRSRPPALPLILWAHPTPAGERVWVWLRPGLDLSALDGKTAGMAETCWASTLRLARASDSYAALIRVDVARRDPLTTLVGNPLMGQLGSADATRPPALVAVPSGLDLTEVPEPPAAAPAQRRR